MWRLRVLWFEHVALAGPSIAQYFLYPIASVFELLSNTE